MSEITKMVGIIVPPDRGGSLRQWDTQQGGDSSNVRSDSEGLASDQSGPVQSSKMSYSDRLKTNVKYDHRLKRNVLEISLEKTGTEGDLSDVDQTAIARVFKTLGIDIERQVEGYQIHYKGNFSIVSVWMVARILISKLCQGI